MTMSDCGYLTKKEDSPLGERKIKSDPGPQRKQEVEDSQSDASSTTLPHLWRPSDNNSINDVTVSDECIGHISLPSGSEKSQSSATKPPPVPSDTLAPKLSGQSPKRDATEKVKSPLTKMIEKSIMLQDQTITPGSSIKNLHDNAKNLPEMLRASSSMPSLIPDDRLAHATVLSVTPPSVESVTWPEQTNIDFTFCELLEPPESPWWHSGHMINIDRPTSEFFVTLDNPSNVSTNDSTDTLIHTDMANYAPLSPLLPITPDGVAFFILLSLFICAVDVVFLLA